MADGLTIGSMSFGYDADGVTAYLDAIKADLLTKAQQDVLDLETINSACDEHWAGKAKEKFKENLASDAQHVADQYEALYTVLQQEIGQALAAMQNKDEEMIDYY